MKRKYTLMLLLILITSVGIMMLETEGQHEPKQEMNITVDIDSDGEFSTKAVNKDELQYYDTKEEAIANADPEVFFDYTYAVAPLSA